MAETDNCRTDVGGAASRWLGQLERLVGIVSVLTLLAYVTGLAITEDFLADFSVRIPQLWRLRFIATGGIFLGSIALYGTPFALLVMTLSGLLYRLMERRLWTRTLFLILLNSVFGLGIWLAGIGPGGFTLPEDSSWNPYLIFCTGMGVALGALLSFARYIVVPRPGPYKIWLLTFVGLLLLGSSVERYANTYYEILSSAFGGGLPVRASFVVDDVGARVLRSGNPKLRIEPVYADTNASDQAHRTWEAHSIGLFDEDEQTYYVLPGFAHSGASWRDDTVGDCVRLEKSHVYGIVFARDR